MSVNQVNPRWKSSFFTIWTGQAFSLLGSQVVQFALVWWLTRTTQSATVLATATLVAVLPQILLGPFVGALVDRWNRKLIMLVADGGTALITLGLIMLFGSGLTSPWHIYLAMALRALGGAFQFPAMQSSTSLMVPKEHLSRVAGMDQALQGVLAIAAPPLGALLLSLFPMQSVLLVDITTAALAIFPLLITRIPQPEAPEIAQGNSGISSFWQDFRAGLAYVRGWPGLMAIMGMAMIINFVLIPAFALSPLLVTKHFHGNVYDLGWMESAVGIGYVAGGLGLSVWGGFRRRVVTSMIGLIGLGLGVILVGLTPGNIFLLGVAGMFIAGAMSPIVNGPFFAVLQSTVAPEMQGRVLSLAMSMSAAMTPVSMAIAGPISDRLGIPIWYLVGGVVCLFMGTAAFWVPAIMNIEKTGDGLAGNTTPVEMPAD
ncbi:MAG TPA: MFS transporter [Anaerolineaceae bacterium]|nr:MFS transporter [Anaerolineaceae bacterium]